MVIQLSNVSSMELKWFSVDMDITTFLVAKELTTPELMANCSSSNPADNVFAGSSSSIPADYVSAGHVRIC
ncbi:hypothetical protein Tco_1246995 [Tanacetum coccineum]